MQSCPPDTQRQHPAWCECSMIYILPLGNMSCSESLWTWRQQHMLSVRSSSEDIQDYQYSVHVSVEKLRNYFVSWWFLLTRELYKSFFCCTEISSTTQAAVLKADWGRQDRGALTFTAVLCSVCPPALSWLTKNKHSSVPKARTSSRQEWTWPGSLESWECWEQASVCYLDRLISK